MDHKVIDLCLLFINLIPAYAMMRAFPLKGIGWLRL